MQRADNLVGIVKAQIAFLLSTLTEDNFAKKREEIMQLIDTHGLDTLTHFLRRLLAAASPSFVSLPPATSLYPPSPQSAGSTQPPTPQSSLALRLLVYEIRRVARDPMLSEHFKDAIFVGDTVAGSEAICRLLDLPRLLCHAALSPLETLLLCSTLISPMLPGQTNPYFRDMRDRRLRTIIDAFQILKVFLPSALDSLGKNRDRVSVDDVPELNALQILKVSTVLCSDLVMPTGEGVEKVVLDKNLSRAYLAACASRWGSPLVGQIVTHALPEMRYVLLTRLLSTFMILPSPATADASSPTFEQQLSSQLAELLILAAKELDVQNAPDATTNSPLSIVGGLNIGLWVRSAGEVKANWNGESVRWSDVVRAFDREGRSLLGETSGMGTVKALAAVLTHSSGNLNPNLDRATQIRNAGVTALWTVWNNASAQVTILEKLLLLNQEVFNLSGLPVVKRIVSLEDASSASPTIRGLAAQVQNSSWNCLELMEVLIKLGDLERPGSFGEEGRYKAKETLERACRSNPELVLIALVQLEKPWNSLHMELAARLLDTFLKGHPSHQLVFLRIWQTDREFLTNALRDFYGDSELNVTRVLDVAHDLKILDHVLSLEPYKMALDVASLASRRELLNLIKWLNSTMETQGTAFVKATLDFLQHKVKYEWSRQLGEEKELDKKTTMQLDTDVVGIFLRALRMHTGLLGDQNKDLYRDTRTLALQAHPKLLNLLPGADPEPLLQPQSFSKEIEKEIDQYFTDMYGNAITVDEVVKNIQKMKESPNPHDQEFFACFLHSLLDEYRFFATYPQLQLNITALLYGNLIDRQVIDRLPLSIAVRYVRDALKLPPTNRLNMFAVQALRAFVSKLSEWLPLAEDILGTPEFVQLHPDIANQARQALTRGRDKEPEDRRLFRAIGYSPDEAGDIEEPQPDQLVADMRFIVNNLAPNNMEKKVEDMSAMILEEYYPWFSTFMLERVKNQPNNHYLYLDFLEALERPPLLKTVLRFTYIEISRLLESTGLVEIMGDKILLRNLGRWLGKLTLQKNLPIKHKDLSLTDLIVEAHRCGRTVPVIAFVMDILEHGCYNSKVFKLPNPWLVNVLRHAKELHNMHHGNLNVRFPIEIACTALGIDLSTIEPTAVLDKRDIDGRLIEEEPESPDPQAAREAALRMRSELFPAGLTIGAMDRIPSESLVGRGIEGLRFCISCREGLLKSELESVTRALQPVPAYLVISPQIPQFANNPGMRRLVLAAFEKAIRECTVPVVDRSVTIAGICTKELAIKDFAMEGDETKMRDSAHSMVASLASSLAHVTAKEPLRSGFINAISLLLIKEGFTEATLPDAAIRMIVNDNIELACGIVEEVAKEKAIDAVDDALSQAYINRQNHRLKSQTPFWDNSAIAASHYSGMLPDPLRLDLTGLTQKQLQVYQDFARRTGEERQQAGRPGSAAPRSASPATIEEIQSITRLKDRDVANAKFEEIETVDQALERFDMLVHELDEILKDNLNITTITQFPERHPVHNLIKAVPVIAARSINVDEAAVVLAQKTVHNMYDTSSKLGRKIYAVILERLCEVAPLALKEVTDWFIQSNDIRKFEVPIFVALLEERLLPVQELDHHLARFIARDPAPAILDFTARLILECTAVDPPLANRHDFGKSLEALSHVSSRATNVAEVTAVFSDPANRNIVQSNLRQRLVFYFDEWIKIYQTSPTLDKHFTAYIGSLQQHGILKGEDVSSLFFRVCTEMSVSTYITATAKGGTPSGGVFLSVDAFAKLIALMIKYQVDAGGNDHNRAKTHYLQKILSIVMLVLSNHHEDLGQHFQQKPFFRFFSSLLTNLTAIEASLGSAYGAILLGIVGNLQTLSPSVLPGFAFSWVGLISHRLLMPKLLSLRDQEGWHAFHRLLVTFFRFLAPFLQDSELPDSITVLYQAAIRILLLLLHDFPAFLSTYYFTLCDAIPIECIQLRNIILSAWASDLHLPDPFRPGIQPSQMVEASRVPDISSDYAAPLNNFGVRGVLDSYLQTRHQESNTQTVDAEMLDALMANLTVTTDGKEDYVKYNMSLIASLVLYLGASAVDECRVNGSHFEPKSSAVFLLSELIINLEPEGKYLSVLRCRYCVLRACATHLRYPNAHTFWFSSLLIHVYGKATAENVKEQITRVLSEVVVAQRPHPWGILYTF
ncbi:Not1-domain-containing protein, partial [Atractiella rhizophila]